MRACPLAWLAVTAIVAAILAAGWLLERAPCFGECAGLTVPMTGFVGGVTP